MENNSIYDVYKQQASGGNQEGALTNQPNSINDILNHNKRDDNSQAPDLKPYPLNLVDEIIADGILSIVNVQSIIKHCKANPALRKKYLPLLDEVEKVIPKIHKAMVEIGNKLDKIK